MPARTIAPMPPTEEDSVGVAIPASIEPSTRMIRISGGMIALKDRQEADNVMLPKVKGAMVLDAALKGRDLDFFILCSSRIAARQKRQLAQLAIVCRKVCGSLQ